MKRLLVAVIVVIVFSGGPSLAQDNRPPDVPDQVLKFMENGIGTWINEWKTEESTGRQVFVSKWGPGKKTMINTDNMIIDGMSFGGTSLVCWDGRSSDGLIGYGVGQDGISHDTGTVKVISETEAKGRTEGIRGGKKFIENWHLVFSGPDTAIYTFSVIEDGKEVPVRKAILRRIKPTTREDFEEFCKQRQGRWVSDTNFTEDWTGFGKKGETFKSYMDITLSEDGNALVIKAYAGEGSWTQLITYDMNACLIKSMWAMSNGSMGHGTHSKINGKWVSKHAEFGPDGTIENTTFPTFSDDGKTWTIKSTGTLDDKKLAPDVSVWHKVSK